jgi:hypothetical protein
VAATVEQTQKAGAVITGLQDADFKKRKTAEAGDALVAFFAILAKKVFPKDAEALQARRVEMMLAAFFLRGELEKLPARPPGEAAAKGAVDEVAALDARALEKRMITEVGDAVLAFFTAFSKKVLGEVDDGAVQLMVLAFLLRRDLA